MRHVDDHRRLLDGIGEGGSELRGGRQVEFTGEPDHPNGTVGFDVDAEAQLVWQSDPLSVLLQQNDGSGSWTRRTARTQGGEDTVQAGSALPQRCGRADGAESSRSRRCPVSRTPAGKRQPPRRLRKRGWYIWDV